MHTGIFDGKVKQLHCVRPTIDPLDRLFYGLTIVGEAAAGGVSDILCKSGLCGG
jgi:hypothetical protein